MAAYRLGMQAVQTNGFEPARTRCCASSKWRVDERLIGPSAVKVAGPPELETIGRLRHRRYVVDQGQPYQTANGDCLIDPIDDQSLNLFMTASRGISFALRMSWWHDIGEADYLNVLKSGIGDLIGDTNPIVCSRFVTDTLDLAKTVILFRRAYQIGVISGAKLSVLSTHEHRVPLFERFGYRRTGKTIDDGIAGPQAVLMLDMYDSKYLTSIKSPLAHCLHEIRID